MVEQGDELGKPGVIGAIVTTALPTYTTFSPDSHSV